MYLPACDDEKTTLRNYLEAQLEAVRASAHGLTDDEARSTPTKSSLSVAGLIKHVTWVMSTALAGAGRLPEPPIPLEDFVGSFSWDSGRTLDELREIFDAISDQYLTLVEESDLETEMPSGPAPWFNRTESMPMNLRHLVVHHVEEFARHAGHADIIREHIDGAQAGPLMMAIHGMAGNDFQQPWQPAN